MNFSFGALSVSQEVVYGGSVSFNQIQDFKLVLSELPFYEFMKYSV